MFRVGQKVVCVDAGAVFPPFGKLTQNAIYTVRAVVSPIPHWAPEVGLLLQEVENGIHPLIEAELNYRASRFRPIVERKTDISIFTAMLNPSKQKVRA